MLEINWKEVKSVLFICTGNVYRSAVANRYFQDQAVKCHLDVKSSSAGIVSAHNMTVDQAVSDMLLAAGIDLRAHSPRQVSQADIDQADIVFVMARNHMEKMLTDFPKGAQKYRMLTSFYEGGEKFIIADGIPDPIQRNIAFHVRTTEIIKTCVDKIIQCSLK